VEKLTTEEVEYILNEAVKRLAERGIFKQGLGHFALDSTDYDVHLRLIVAAKVAPINRHDSNFPVFLTSLPVNQPLEVLDAYDLRSLIENCAFRELKQGWLLGKFPKKTEEAVRSHVFLTVVMFNLTNAYPPTLVKIWPSEVSGDNAWPGKIPTRCLSLPGATMPSLTSKNCSSSQDANRKSVGGLARPKSDTVTIIPPN
jgi:hypothetical protein